MVQTQENPMRTVDIDKVTVNICVGNDKLGMQKADLLLRKLTNKTPVKNAARRRIATWRLRKGLAIGYKVTLRGEEAKKFLKWILDSKDGHLSRKSLDQFGNFSVGFNEYLDLNGMKYDADIGILGFEVMVTFSRPGYRIRTRDLNKRKIPKRHKVTPEEVVEYMTKNFGVRVE